MEFIDEVPRIKRPQFLLNGRRVRVSDLIDANLLEPGAKLGFDQPTLGKNHSAVVTEAGELKLDDGRLFKTPSGAGDAVAGMSTAGWNVWTVESSGKILDALRQELLANLAERQTFEEEIHGGESADLEQVAASERYLELSRYQFLNDARQKAHDNDPVRVTVRGLLTYWGANRRGYRICSKIENDFVNHDLTTSPDYREVGLDAEVCLERAAVKVRQLDAGEKSGAEAVELRRTVGTVPSASPSASRELASVTLDAPLEEAITMMLLDDFSQLAVLAGKYKLCGAVTWKSIANARHTNPGATLRDARVEADLVPYDRDLIEILPLVQDRGFVFVKGATGEVDGIVATADVVDLYEEAAGPFLLIGELDRALRNIISSVFSVEEINSLCRAGVDAISSADEMSFDDYRRMLENPDIWAKLDWRLDRVTFVNRLVKVRDIRNDVMHFNPDPLPPATMRQLRELIKIVHRYSDF
ncbi:MAG: CBS domain-containing protein [Pseudonocardiaceae bacterium]